MDDGCDVAATADGQQQSPGEQRVGVQLNSLRIQGGPAAILAHIWTGEKALETLHGGINVLEKEEKRKKKKNKGIHIKSTAKKLNSLSKTVWFVWACIDELYPL